MTKRGAFANAVLEGSVPHPDHQDFDFAGWDSAHKRLRSAESDDRLYMSGLWFYERFQEFQSKIRASHLLAVTPSRSVPLLCGIANYHIRALENESRKSHPVGETWNTAESVSPRITLSSGGKFSEDELLGSIVDGVQYPMFFCMKKSEAGPETNAAKDLSEDCITQFGLGSLYSFLRNVWYDCVGARYQIDESDNARDVLRPVSMDEEAAHTLTIFRRENAYVQEIHLNSLAWLRLSKEHRKEIFQSKIVGRVVREGKKLRPIVVSYDYSSEIAPSGWIFSNMAREVYYQELLDETFPRYAGLSVKLLIDGWQLLSSLANALYERTPNWDARTEKQFLEHAPQWNVSNLVRLLSKGLSWNWEVAAQVVSFLTYRGDRGQDLWAQPLVRCSDQKVVITFASLMYGNLLRVIERWLRQGGVELGGKGHAFERHVRRELKDYFAGSALCSKAVVCDDAIRMPVAGGGVEEIDLVILMGNVVLVGEVKCLLAPADSIEYLRYFDALDGAAQQIERKRAAIQADIPGFLSRLGPHVRALSNVEVIPLVITNSAVGVGFPIRNVPVVDLRTFRVFTDGSYAEWSVFDKGRIVEEKRGSIYSSFEEAQRVLNSFLNFPPFVKVTRPFLRERSVPLSNRERDSKPARLVCLEVDTERLTAARESDQRSLRKQ